MKGLVWFHEGIRECKLEEIQIGGNFQVKRIGMGWRVMDSLGVWVDFGDTVHIMRGGATAAVGMRMTMESGTVARSGSGIITSSCSHLVNSVFNDACIRPITLLLTMGHQDDL